MGLAVYPVCGPPGEILFEQAEIQCFGLAEHSVYRELIDDAPPRSFAESVRHFRLVQQPADSVSDFFGVLNRNQETGPAVFNQFGISSNACRDNGYTGRHGFQNNVR